VAGGPTQRGLISGDMSVVIPDIMSLHSSVSGWTKCRVKSDEDAVLQVKLSVGSAGPYTRQVSISESTILSPRSRTAILSLCLV